MQKELMIEAEGIKKSFNGSQVLKGINLVLHKEENLVILGRSGVGKSVLIKTMVGLITQDEGKMCVLGQDISSLDKEALKRVRQKVGYLFQGGALYDSMTVRENLEFPIKRMPHPPKQSQIDEQVKEILLAVGLSEAIDKMPEELSGGMKKRIALARTLILRPSIILYDEPTTGLDPITSREISGLIVKMKEKYQIASITITHDMMCAKLTADRIMILEDGKLKEHASFEEMMRSGEKLVNAYFE